MKATPPVRAAALVLAVLACVYTYRLEATDSFSRPAADFDALRLETDNGQIAVSATTDSIARVTVERYAYGRDSADAAGPLESITVTDTLVGSTWTVEADVPSGRRSLGALMDASVRAKVRVAASTSNGAVTVSGMTAGADISTTNGKVTTSGTEGNLNVSTSNGAVTIQVHRGSVAASTTSGVVNCDLALLEATGQASISTTNGAVTLLLPADVSATVEATTTNGDVLVSGFQFQYEEQTATHIRGRIGSGAATITIETTDGDVSIRPRN